MGRSKRATQAWGQGAGQQDRGVVLGPQSGTVGRKPASEPSSALTLGVLLHLTSLTLGLGILNDKRGNTSPTTS